MSQYQESKPSQAQSSQHTLGPCVADQRHFIRVAASGLIVGTTAVNQAVRSQSECAATARLFASSPDLLESLRQLVAEIDPNNTMADPDLSSHRPVIAARAALLKAGVTL